MKKIVQLSDSEYNELVKQAEMTEEQIQAAVKREMEDICNLEVRLSLDSVEGGFRFCPTFKFKPIVHAKSGFYPKDNSGKYFISLEACSHIADRIQRWMNRQIEENYGDWFEEIDNYKKITRNQWKWRTLFTLLSVTGWAVAAVIFCLK